MSRTIEIAPTPTHSAGKWQAQQEGYNPETGFPVWVVVGPESAICKVYTFGEDERPRTAEANAVLIAEAPTMLQALKDLTAEIHLSKLNIRKDFSLINAHAAALRAIHKATGGAR
jgi:hypothetical protein